jgi:hypothetical protein
LEHPGKIVGCILADIPSSAPDSTNDFTLSLYTDVLGTPASQMSISPGATNLQGVLNNWLLFDADVTLAANTVYGLAIKADSTGNRQMVRYDYAANADLAWHAGVEIYSITRNNGSGAFTAGNANVYAIYPIFSALDDGTGGGSTVFVGTNSAQVFPDRTMVPSGSNWR